VPQEITIALLSNAMKAALESGGATANGGGTVPEKHRSKWTDGKGRFLVDGFPRKMDQAVGFDEEVSSSRMKRERGEGREGGATAMWPAAKS
jgi:UMP-CMP kinase